MVSGQGVRTSARVALLFSFALTVAAAAFFTFTSSVDAHPQKPCDPYVQKCPPTRTETVSPDITTTHIGPTDPGKRNKLQVTGADLTLFIATGIAAIGTGGVLVRATRSRR